MIQVRSGSPAFTVVSAAPARATPKPGRTDVQGRYELKFPIPALARAEVVAAARQALVEDPHGDHAVYRVSSQYFDDHPHLPAYWEKLDGERVRRKFRLRTYSLEGTGQGSRAAGAFMEIKHRIGNTVFKERVRLSDAGAQAILEDSLELRRLEEHLAPGEAEARPSTLEAILRAAHAPGFRAAAVITYLREAWLGAVDAGFRLTFDMHCQVYPPAAFHRVDDRQGRPILAPAQAIMEVKFDRAVPRWMRDVVVEHGLAMRPFSKYAAGVEALGLVPTP